MRTASCIQHTLRRVLIAALIPLLASPALLPAAETEPERAVIPKLEGRLDIDGQLGESVWAKAVSLPPFRLNSGERAGTEATEVRLWYDDSALYLAWICTDSDIQATFTERDSRFWEEEVAEFFVTTGELSRYYELQWNPLGGVFDAIIKNELNAEGRSNRFEGEWGWTARGMQSAVMVEGTVENSRDSDKRWQVEVRLPFADLGESTPKPGDIWRANFYRFNRTTGKPVEMLSWSPTRLPSFHEPSQFGYIQFGE